MLKTYAYQFVELNHDLEQVLYFIGSIGLTNQVLQQTGQYPKERAELMVKWPEVYRRLDEALDRAAILCEDLNLRAACKQIKRLKDEQPYKEEHFRYIGDLVREVRQRVEDELNMVQFLFVPTSKAEFYDKPIFGTAVEERFPQAIDDIRAAGNCYSVGQWTATVHHCMGIVQVALTELAKHFEIQIDIYLDDWNFIITKVEGAVKQLKPPPKEPSSEWRQSEPFYSEIISDIRGIKDAWRNPTAHFRRQYDEAQAKKVLEKVGDFMRNLAVNLG